MAYQVLIVDDNEHNRFTLTSLLGSMSIESLEAENGSQALTYLMKNKVDLIILDIQLPDYNGFDLAKIIKKRKSTMGIPIIFATAIFKSDEFINKGFALGAVDYILKPINLEMFVAKIEYYKAVYDERKTLISKLTQKNMILEKNLTSLNRAEKQLKQSERQWKRLGENIPYLVEIYSSSNQLKFSNENSHNEALKKVYQDNQDSILTLVNITLNDRRTYVKRIKVEDPRNKELYYYEVTSIYMNESDESQCMIILKDVTLQQLHEDGMAYIGYHDHLTGVWNRHYFNEYIETMDRHSILPITIVMSDCNGLKMINDSFGHKSGDDLIKIASKCLLENTPSNSIVARWGGDEFIVLIPNCDENQAQTINNNIHRMIKSESLMNKFPVSMAIGTATNEQAQFVISGLIKEAEDKMYVNKMQNQSSYRSSVLESLKNALFEQDYETEAHTERISQMGHLIASHLGLSQNDKDRLSLVGSLHDIGKIALPKTILNKKEKLSEADWLTIKRHPEIGFRICSTVPELSSIAELVLAHHERWDGKGYPRGLKGTEIPMLARLISILDTFDVITHNRPYKEKQTSRWALEELKRCAGTQFDPNLVNVFEHVYNSIEFSKIE